MSGEETLKKHRSVMWNYFTKVDQNYARCSMCSKLFSYGSTTTNLKRHLERVHHNLDMKTVDMRIMIGNEEDPREGLKEFIHLEGEDLTGEDERDDADGQLRDGDTDWAAASSRKIRKSAPPAMTRRSKPEVISSNGVDYVIYTDEQPRASAPTIIPARPLVSQAPARTSMAPTPRPPSAPAQVEDEFTTFAKFLSQRIRSFKDPYWQSCAINEINIALHRVEMRRYEPPRAVPTSVISVQTDSFALPVISRMSIHDSEDIVEEIVSHEDTKIGSFG